MNWRPNVLQIILFVAIFLGGLIALLSITVGRSLTAFSYASRVTLLFIGIFFMYTGYSDQEKKSSDKSPLSAYHAPLIGSGVVIILFVLLLSVVPIFNYFR